jgi:hypothetical protein
VKSVSCIVWILGALLLAALDTRPDPPAVNPGSTGYKSSQIHAFSCPDAVQRCDSFVASNRFLTGELAAVTSEPGRSTDPMVIAGHAANSSPPTANRA